MLKEELIKLVDNIIIEKCEGQTLEIKSANKGFPKIYDTLSSFSNQTQGGIIIFGIEESKNFEVVGVYNVQDLLHKISEQCKQMEPEIRGITTECLYEGKPIVSLEVPSAEIFNKPVYYKGAGIMNGSYVRVGDADEPMTDYEIYSYEAYRQHKQDDIREAPENAKNYLDKNLINQYLNAIRIDKPNTNNLSNEEILELMGILKNGHPTLSSVLIFSKYPQAFFPQLCITAVLVPGYSMGDIDEDGRRFLNNKKIEGTIPEMVESALSFVAMNSPTSVKFKDGKRIDEAGYPLTAIREAITNALVHRDYSIHTEGMPVRLEMYKDRLEIINAGGLYGPINISDLGRIHADTRNKNLVTILETLHKVENRYSGIPTIIKEMREANLPKPLFISEKGLFKVVLYNGVNQNEIPTNSLDEKIINFCKTERTKKEVADFLGKTQYWTVKNYIEPLIAKGKLRYTIEDKPKSKLQKIITK